MLGRAFDIRLRSEAAVARYHQRSLLQRLSSPDEEARKTLPPVPLGASPLKGLIPSLSLGSENQMPCLITASYNVC